ncbi:MAG: hypothetical protein GY854_22185 [Deltaproteobacteria bacterium]|nr:hypothetical protein [Deltaproteobacteria bacterium]
MFFLVVSLGAARAAGDTPSDAVLVDGLAALAGGQAANELDSIVILKSDMEFEAALLLLRRNVSGGLDKKLDDVTRKEARRCAVLIRMLARQAKQFQEVVNPEEKTALRKALVSRAGGPDQMEALLARHGMGESDLTAWIETALLASTQVRYMEDQVDLPSDREIDERARVESSQKSGVEEGDTYDKYRRLIIEERTKQSVKRWLDSLLEGGRVRIMQ